MPRYSTRWTRLALAAAALLALLVFVSAQDYYKILGLTRSATKQQIKKAYKKLSMKYHPDKRPGDEEAEKKFIEIGEAYDALNDDESRRIYDNYGAEGLKKHRQGQDAGGHHGFHNPFDIFEQFFGGAFGGGGGGGGRRHYHQQQKRGADIVVQLYVSLEDLYNGKEIDYDISKYVVCPKCRGSGADHPDDVTTCPVCGGHGVRVVKQMIAPGFYQQFQTTCEECGGKGKVYKSKCSHCSGHKVVRGNDQLSVTIERGLRDAQVLTYEREADQHPDHIPGDIKFVINTLPHDLFTRPSNSDDLHMDLELTLEQALVGFSVNITHLDGRNVTIARKSAITPPGHKMTMTGEGMPKHGAAHETGDLIVTCSLNFPKHIDEKAGGTIKKLFASGNIA
ncbi:DnaJ-domain-containing protein [Ramicandelaber brevisporus]|nr:DnaJ-domain-containing protein [Ramicandelaber brevisporus]